MFRKTVPDFAALNPGYAFPVMPARVAGIHVFPHRCEQGVDGRDKPGHDGPLKLCDVVEVMCGDAAPDFALLHPGYLVEPRAAKQPLKISGRAAYTWSPEGPIRLKPSVTPCL
jgi:hypothetical protein